MSEQMPILVVEDDENERELVRLAFRKNQLGDLVTVSDGYEALDYLYQQGSYKSRPPGLPRLMILDLKIPRINGLELLKKIKTDPSLKHVPVVVFTSSNQQQYIYESFTHGANDYIVKPYRHNDYVDALKDICRKWANGVPASNVARQSTTESQADS